MTIEEYLSEENQLARQKAEKIYFKLFGAPKTHNEWANSFNIIGEIKQEIYEKG